MSIKHCETCKRELDVPGVPESVSCGGDCRHCMAHLFDDPDEREALGLPRCEYEDEEDAHGEDTQAT